jgi:hypothetical protein
MLEHERSQPRKPAAFDQVNELPELKRQKESLKLHHHILSFPDLVLDP